MSGMNMGGGNGGSGNSGDGGNGGNGGDDIIDGDFKEI